MCGFAGFLQSTPNRPAEELDALAAAMARTVAHRGPDDQGVWVDASAGCALGFRRLSILDLSSAGRQPMSSPSGRFVIVYNGEVYNHESLRRTLSSDRKIQFRGRSDTEAILAAIEEWGLEQALDRFIGMFAFALWDRERRTLTLARDRLGVKPLYYGLCGGDLLFGSELKALRAHPRFSAAIDRSALSEYARYGYIPAPRSIYEGVYKLPPGSLVELRAGDSKLPAPRAYWSAAEVARAGRESPVSSMEAAVTETHQLLEESVRLRMVADVPLGVLLSGGIDSSLVTALMQRLSPGSIRSFSIGFQEAAHDESAWARKVADHLGACHTEHCVTPREALDLIPQIPRIYDEPFADASQIPTFLVSSLARRHVTVALSGDGGDELFGGYTRYLWGPRLWNRVRPLPAPARSAAGRLLQSVPPSLWDSLPTRQRAPADKVHKLAQALTSVTEMEFFRALRSHWPRPEAVVLGGSPEPEPPGSESGAFVERMMLADQTGYLPDDILVKVDRASMAVGLEAREPLLDHRLFALSWRIPLSLKIENGRGKLPLRRILSTYVPDDLIQRPKAGFTLPLDRWLRGPLRDWAEGLLDPARLRREGYFDAGIVERVWREHRLGRRNRQLALWDILMFQTWLDHIGAAGRQG